MRSLRENALDLPTLIRLPRAMVDVWRNSHRRPARAITLDIDDTADSVHGHQPLSLFNAYHGERCFPPARLWCKWSPLGRRSYE